MSKKKKIIVLSCMILLLAVTAVCNFLLTSKTSAPNDGNAVTTANYFSQYRTERLTSRNEQILQLDAIIESAEDGSEAKTNALGQKLKLTENMEKELLLENLIKATGYADVVVTIGLSSENINVIVKDAELTKDDALVIYTILQDEVGASPEYVKIIPIS